MKKLFLALVSVTSLSTPAVATDFSGIRAEARLAYDNVALSLEYDDPTMSVRGSDNETGVGYGVEVGYDGIIGPDFTLGSYAGIDFSNTDFCSPLLGNDEFCLRTGRNITAGVRAGYAVNPIILLYAKGGYSNTRLKASYSDPDGTVRGSTDRDGVHFGAGVEFAFTPNAYGKLEYLRTEYKGAGFKDEDVSAFVNGSRDQVFAGVGVRF